MSQNRRFCPNCGSEHVEPDTSHSNMLGEMIFNQNKWVCNNCGYSGLVPEREPEDESSGDLEFEEVEQDRSIDASGGTAYFEYFFYILLPLTLGYLLYLILT